MIIVSGVPTAVISYAGNYNGGHHWIADGWDYGILVIFSSMILCLAQYFCSPKQVTAAYIEALALEKNQDKAQ